MSGTQFFKRSSTIICGGLFAVVALNFSAGKGGVEFPEKVKNTVLAKLKEKDSLNYYQVYCAVSGKPNEYLSRDSVFKHQIKKGLITVTEKFTVIKNGSEYQIRRYSSTINDYPNKKFAYLKLTEKDYWNFSMVRDTVLSKESIFRLAALELKLRPLTEYDFKVEWNNYPQLIINGRKTSEQQMIEGNYLLETILPELK
jgi:hypothetical protein